MTVSPAQKKRGAPFSNFENKQAEADDGLTPNKCREQISEN